MLQTGSRGDGREDRRVRKLKVVVPVFNDWDSFGMLVRDLDRVASELGVHLTVSAVDDGSTDAMTLDSREFAGLERLDRIEVIQLATNIGHQRAIAVGLCAALEDEACDAVVVMDADGEDSPAAIRELIEAAGDGEHYCVVARRGKRSESATFKFAYLLYKIFFRLLTGREIVFGNFCLLSRSYVRRLVNIPDLWNNVPAAILRSRLPIRNVTVNRAQRYAGRSKMGLTSLVVHGFSGISVYADTIFVRFFFFSSLLFLLSVVSIVFVLTLRIFFPQYATPGWASTVTFGLSIILVQILSFTLSFILVLFNGRLQMPAIPLKTYEAYIDHRWLMHGSQGEWPATGNP